MLAIAYVCAEFAQGALKMMMNIYRGWVGENSVRYLRSKVLALGAGATASPCSSRDEGVDIAIVVAEPYRLRGGSMAVRHVDNLAAVEGKPA